MATLINGLHIHDPSRTLWHEPIPFLFCPAAIPVLSVEMQQSIQEEAQPEEGAVDQGLPQGPRQGNDCRFHIPVREEETGTACKSSLAYAAIVWAVADTAMVRCSGSQVLFFFPLIQVPMKYDRDLWGNTLMAMKRVQEIRQKREQQFIKNRCVCRIRG